LFLGWSLGANDAANIYGTAVGSRMISFKKAAIVASIFVILGAVLQGHGTTKTLSELGSVDAIGGAFTVALCSAIVVTLMTKYRLPVSTGQAIVGAILGWGYFTSTTVEYAVLGKIVGSWVFGPVLGAIFSALLYMLLRKYIRSSRLNLLKMETIIRFSLLIVGAFGAYSLGANNIANVMGVFVNSFTFSISIGIFSISSTQILFFVGSVAIALGIFTYSKRVMQTVGSGILSMTPEAAIVVVLAQALVLFVFSSSTLSNLFVSIGLPAIPLVPVSSTQVVIGSVLGIGLVKGMQEIKFKMIGNIMLGWILTPILSGAFTFFTMFFVQSVFHIKVTNKDNVVNVMENVATPEIVNYEIPLELNALLISFLLVVLALFLTYFVISHFRNKEKTVEKEERWLQQMQFSEYQKALSEIEVNTVQLENTNLATRLEEKRNELVTYSLNISEQRQYLESIYTALQKALSTEKSDEKNAILKQQLVDLKQKMSFAGEIDKIYQQAEQVHAIFIEKLNSQFPDLTTQEKRLMVLLRIGLSSKEIRRY
jgi:phosphate/sulfate permease